MRLRVAGVDALWRKRLRNTRGISPGEPQQQKLDATFCFKEQRSRLPCQLSLGNFFIQLCFSFPRWRRGLLRAALCAAVLRTQPSREHMHYECSSLLMDVCLGSCVHVQLQAASLNIAR